MDYPHPVLWKGEDLKGDWDFTIKIDGVRMLRDKDGKPVSRDGKPLFGLDNLTAFITDAEIYGGDWEKSISLVRRHDAPDVPLKNVFSLFPLLDPRLFLYRVKDPKKDDILASLKAVVEGGCEGLVLREVGGKQRILKVKTKETYDVPVIDIQMGTGKHEGRMGALITPMGKVGTGFTDEQRTELLNAVGKIIEVDCMQLTANGKFRHPRFIRVREDKC